MAKSQATEETTQAKETTTATQGVGPKQPQVAEDLDPSTMPFEQLLDHYRANAAQNNWGFDPILIVGPTGTGKSASIENLPPQKTFILNAEEQPLPFRTANQFKGIWQPKEPDTLGKDGKPVGLKAGQILNIIRWMSKSNYGVVILDSLSEAQGRNDQEAQILFTGFDRANHYNARLAETLDLLRTKDKFSIAFSHPMNIAEVAGSEQTCAIAQGQWKGKIETKFTIVLHAMVKPKADDEGIEYVFLTSKVAGHEKISAKSPVGMFNTYEPNDLAHILRKVMLYRMGY